MLIKKGLCSVTFRNKRALSVIKLAKEGGLDAVEWGGDIHLPPWNRLKAKRIKRICDCNDIKILSYGSYFRCDSVSKFIKVSNLAKIIGAKIIRVWAGNKDASEYTADEKEKLIEVLLECAEIAGKNGQIIAMEYHYGTYNNCAKNSLELIKAVGKPNFKTYWQPSYWTRCDNPQSLLDYNKSEILMLKDNIVGVHIYHWIGRSRLPLKEGVKDWQEYVAILPDCYGFLEFVKGGSKKRYFDDVATLIKNL